MKTKLINSTGEDIILKVMSNGISTKLVDLKRGGVHTITTDINATYTEYLIAFAVPRERDPKVITSDDLAEYPKITIFMKNEDTKETLDWIGSADERKLSTSNIKRFLGIGRRDLTSTTSTGGETTEPTNAAAPVVATPVAQSAAPPDTESSASSDLLINIR